MAKTAGEIPVLGGVSFVSAPQQLKWTLSCIQGVFPPAGLKFLLDCSLLNPDQPLPNLGSYGIPLTSSFCKDKVGGPYVSLSHSGQCKGPNPWFKQLARGKDNYQPGLENFKLAAARICGVYAGVSGCFAKGSSNYQS